MSKELEIGGVVLDVECIYHSIDVKKVDDYIVSYCSTCGKIISIERVD